MTPKINVLIYEKTDHTLLLDRLRHQHHLFWRLIDYYGYDLRHTKRS